MKKIILFLIITVISISFIDVNATTNLIKMFNGWEMNVEGVYQGTDGVNFAANMVSANVYIDPYITTKRDYVTEIVTSEKGFYKCVERITSTLGDRISICYDGSIENATQLKNDKVNVFSGDLFYFEYPKTATLLDGTTANVRITFSNLRLVIDTRSNNIDLNSERILLASGNIIVQDNTYVGNYSYPARGLSTAYKVDVKIQIVDNRGNPIPNAIFVYGMTDIDVIRRNIDLNASVESYLDFGSTTPVSASRYLYDPSGNASPENYYSESVLVRSGQIGDLYIPGGTADDDSEQDKGYKCYITNERDGIRFHPTINDRTSSEEFQTDGNLYSGFLAAVDNNIGMNLTIWNVGNGQELIFKTFLLSGQSTNNINYSHRVKSTSNSGGKIETPIWNEDTNTEEYKDSHNDIFTVADSGSISFKFTPEEGYQLKKVYLSDSGIDYTNGWKNNGKVNSTSALYENGYYTLTFSQIKSDAAIHVEWEKIGESGVEIEVPDTMKNIHVVYIVIGIITILLGTKIIMVTFKKNN